MYKRIVVPLDGSRFAEAALAPARELARTFGARILLVRAVPPHDMPDILPGFFTDTIGGDGHQADVDRANDADAYLHGMTDQLRRAGYDADMALAIAAPGAGIAEAVAVDHADVVVMASHLRWKVPATTGASATLDVLVRSRVPLLAWRVSGVAETEGELDVADRPSVLARAESPLVVPLDGSTLAEAALPTAEALARAFGLYLVLVRAVSKPEQQDEARRYLADVTAAVEGRGVRVTAASGTGDPFDVIERSWREQSGGLIVMASRGRLGAHGSFFGSLAARIIEELEAPVLVVRP
jgi:nucleotide-binding universal stress UspA family protein